MKRDVRIDMRYPHSPAVMWRALASADAMSEWLMPNTFQPKVGHRFEFRTKPAPGFDGIVHCQVVELEPPSCLAFTWVGGGIDTLVRFELQADGSGTTLSFTQSGFKGVKAVVLSYMLANGWKAMLNRKLPRAVASLQAGATIQNFDLECQGESTRFWRLFDRAFRRSPVTKPR